MVMKMCFHVKIIIFPGIMPSIHGESPKKAHPEGLRVESLLGENVLVSKSYNIISGELRLRQRNPLVSYTRIYTRLTLLRTCSAS